jgi:hypothetical protein
MSSTLKPCYRHSASSRLVRVPDWPKLPPEIRLYKASMIAPNSRGFIYLTHRGENPVLCLNPDGSLRQIVGKDVLTKSTYYYQDSPEAPPQLVEDAFCLHGLHIDPWDNVWVTDFARHLVLRFDPAGKVTLTLGVDGKAGCDSTHFNQPTHTLVLPSGEFFVADGYVNSRIVKFSPQGRFIKAWGIRGTGRGEFHTPHVLALGPDGRLYVSDRENSRVQIFDLEGNLLEMWSGLYCVDGLAFSANGQLWGSCGPESALFQFGPRGELKQVWKDPTQSPYPDRWLGPFPQCDYPHGIWIDGEDTIYIAESTPHPEGSRILKFKVEA